MKKILFLTFSLLLTLSINNANAANPIHLAISNQTTQTFNVDIHFPEATVSPSDISQIAPGKTTFTITQATGFPIYGTFYLTPGPIGISVYQGNELIVTGCPSCQQNDRAPIPDSGVIAVAIH